MFPGLRDVEGAVDAVGMWPRGLSVSVSVEMLNRRLGATASRRTCDLAALDEVDKFSHLCDRHGIFLERLIPERQLSQ